MRLFYHGINKFSYRKTSKLVLLFLFVVSFTTVIWAQQAGNISGKVSDKNTGEALIGVNILLKGTNFGNASNVKGEYEIKNIPVGTYTVVFSAVGYSTEEIPNVEVQAGKTISLNASLAPKAFQLGDIAVYGASRRREKITDAPAAISVLGTEEIKLNASHGQLPRLLEAQPGVDLVQSGMQDFNVNSRGFNSSVTRRVLVLMDGRDLSAAFLGQQEWGSLSIPLDDIDNIEFVRGPGSALYGTNAFNGVINITTLAPRKIAGTKISLSAGELNMFRGDIRQAGVIDDHWSYKVNVGRVQSDSWDENRLTPPFEYPGLRPERRAIEDKKLSYTYGSGRIDYDFENGDLITAEGGITQVDNDVLVTGIGRLNVGRGLRPWGRLHYGSQHLDLQAWAEGRTTERDIHSLASGGRLSETSSIVQFEGQYNYSFFNDDLKFIIGGSHRFGHVNMDETAMAGTQDYTVTGAYGQVEYKLLPNLNVIAAGRFDRTTYEATRFSPRGAVVWNFVKNHTFRVTYNKAFLLPSVSEYFLRVLAGVRDLSPLGINKGKPTRILALGNENLTPERIEGVEVGYKGIFLDNKLFVTVDGYANRVNNFITDLLQGVNPVYPFNGAPAGLADLIRNGSPSQGIPAIPGLTVLPSGETAIVLSYTNKGKVDERGVEVSFNYYVVDELMLMGNWSWFDFDVKEQQTGDQLLPNNPKHKFGFGATYKKDQLEVSLTGRYVQSFKWAAGVFVGEIPSYTLFNFAAGYQVNNNVRLGLNVTNLFDNEVYQIFGGSVIGRQAIGTVTLTF